MEHIKAIGLAYLHVNAIMLAER